MSEKQKVASRPQLLHLAGSMAQNMPADLPSDVATEWINDPEALQQFLVGLRHGTYPIAQVKTDHAREVTIYPSRTIEQWVDAGRYDHWHSQLTTTNLGQFLTVQKNATEAYKAKVMVFNLGCTATTEKAKRIRTRLGLKPIGFEHIAAIGEQYRGFEHEWLVNLDTVYDHGVVCINIFGNYRSLDLRSAYQDWSDDTWFLGLQ